MPRQPRLDIPGPLHQVMGRELVVAITKGKLNFGPWEHGEFDGFRRKRVLVKIIGG
jgi:thiamine phosphate synthase YjbQ (UPF0047 family)